MANLTELLLRLYGYNMPLAIKALNEIQNAGHEARESLSERKWEIFKYHLKHNEFYKSFIGKKSVGSWEEIPEMMKADYQQSLSHLITGHFKKKQLYIANTSGSSGQPFVFAKNKFCHALAWALIRQRYRIYNIGLNSLQARFFGIPLSGRPAMIEKFKDRLMNRVRFSVFDISDDRLFRFVEQFKKLKFEYIYGYTNSVRHFCRFLLDNDISLRLICPSLKCVIVTAEMCNVFDKRIIEAATGVPCIVEYGASETGVIGFEFRDGQLHGSDELMFLETDESGSLLVTSLYNRAFPMIRYNIGDKVKLRSDSRDCATIIEKINGRSDDLIRLPNGKVAAGISIYYCSKYILENMTALKELYVTQTKMSEFKVFYIGDMHLSDYQKSLVTKSFDTYLAPGLKVEFIKTEFIRRKANGKLQIFHSELQS